MAQASSPPTVRCADVALDVRTGGSGAVYTYRDDIGIKVGDAVFVPLGNRQVLGFVVKAFDGDDESLGYSIEKLKPIESVVAGLSLPDSLIELVQFTATEYLCPVPVALSPATPPGALDRLVTSWRATLDFDAAMQREPLTPLQQEVLKSILDMGGKLQQSGKTKLQATTLKALRLLKAKGLIEEVLELGEGPKSRATSGLLRLTPDSGKVDAFLKTFAKKRPAQALTLLRMREIEDAALTPADIKGLCGVTETTVKQLVDAGLLVRPDSVTAAPATPPQPNKEQQIAIDAIVESVNERDPHRFLLFGVTGSGKTEVYLRAAAEAMRLGRQVLYLVPEIALATQAVKQLRERFGKAVAILHSELPPQERLENWLAVRSGEAAIVLGARSAIFAPFRDLGLIVMDEEHEASYKQESAPRYHAKRLCQFLAEQHRCPLVLGSATPSIESFFEAEHEKLTLLSLPKRAAEAKLPDVHVIDLAEAYRSGKPALFSEMLLEKMERTLERKEQVILFLNRRAYAPFLLCRDCGHQFRCDNCAVSLTYSRKLNRLRCHHCGHSEHPPQVCPECQGNRINPIGVGTEKVEEAVRECFPNARTARLDRDIAQRKGALEETLAGFGSGEIDVLVGTQMVAKGLNFPGVTLVGVILADLSLNIPDFRATERTFQLLSQVAGRAGRGQKPGEVVIQTFSPQHPAILAAQEHDYHSIYDALRDERSEAQYPPFVRLVNIIATGAELQHVQKAINEVHESVAFVQLRDGASILGPVDCALERLQGNWRMHVLLKLPTDFGMEAIGEALASIRHKDVQVMMDVDPYSLL